MTKTGILNNSSKHLNLIVHSNEPDEVVTKIKRINKDRIQVMLRPSLLSALLRSNNIIAGNYVPAIQDRLQYKASASFLLPTNVRKIGKCHQEQISLNVDYLYLTTKKNMHDREKSVWIDRWMDGYDST